MKIATYNVNSINARLPVLLHWLAFSKPDVACLQELKTADEKFPIEAIREAGYEAVWHGQKAWNGVAILAARSPRRRVGAFQATRTIPTAATSRPWWAGSPSAASTCPTATRPRAEVRLQAAMVRAAPRPRGGPAR